MKGRTYRYIEKEPLFPFGFGLSYVKFEYGGCFKDIGIKLNDVIDFLKSFGYYTYELKNKKFSKIETYNDDYKWTNFYATKLNNII